MCLVSFAPRNGHYVLTSNRDESTSREKPLAVTSYTHNPKNLTYPKDIAGGTWIAHDNHNNGIILLNGAYQKHVRASSYRKSRGLIVLELLSSPDPLQAWKDIELHNIEPFTLVHFTENKKLYDHVWDGHTKTSNQLDIHKGHMWMSATLYTRDYYSIIKKRFDTINLNDSEALHQFHSTHLYQDNTQDYIIPVIKTVSISTMTMHEGKTSLSTIDHRTTS